MKKLSLLFIAVIFSFNAQAHNCTKQPCDIFIRDGKFESGVLQKAKGEKCLFQLKAGKKYRLNICNLDKKPAEFESHALKIEKIIKGESHAKVRVKNLKKGETYEFEEEFGGYHCKFEAI